MRLFILSGILGSIFSACVIFGKNILTIDTTAVNTLYAWSNILMRLPIFWVAVFLIFKFVPKINKIFYVKFLENVSLKKYFLVSWLLIFLAWLPVLFAQYPGIYGYDAWIQVLFYNIDLYPFHFPPIHSWLMGFCTVTLGDFFGSYEIGFLIYTLLQMICLALTFAVIQAYMYQKKISAVFRVAWQVFFMFFPANPIMAISATKNIFYANFFCLSILILVIIIEKNSVKRLFLPLVAVSFLSIIFISQGIYVFLFGMFFGFLLLKDLRFKLFKVTASVFALFATYMFLMINFFHGVPDSYDSLIEMSSVPTVQLSRVAIYRREELSKQEFDEIKNYIPAIEHYAHKLSQGSSDYVRPSLQLRLIKQNPQKFLKMYIKLMLKYPADYFNAVCRTTVGFWCPSFRYENYYYVQPYFQWESFKRISKEFCVFYENPFENRVTRYPLNQAVEDKYVFIDNNSLFGLEWLNEIFKDMAYNYSYEKISVVRYLFSGGTAFWFLMIYIFYCLAVKDYRKIFPAMFLLGLWLTMILGPMTLYRYVFPLVMCIPILFVQLVIEPK